MTTNDAHTRIYLDMPYKLMAGGQRDLDRFPKGIRGFQFDVHRKQWYATNLTPPHLYDKHHPAGRYYFDVSYDDRELFKRMSDGHAVFDRSRRRWYTPACTPAEKIEDLEEVFERFTG